MLQGWRDLLASLTGRQMLMQLARPVQNDWLDGGSGVALNAQLGGRGASALRQLIVIATLCRTWLCSILEGRRRHCKVAESMGGRVGGFSRWVGTLVHAIRSDSDRLPINRLFQQALQPCCSDRVQYGQSSASACQACPAPSAGQSLWVGPRP